MFWIREVLIRIRIRTTRLRTPDPLFSVAFKMPIKKCGVFLLGTYFAQQSSTNSLLSCREIVEIVIFFIFWLFDERIRIGSVNGRPITLRLRIPEHCLKHVSVCVHRFKLSYWSGSESLCGKECCKEFSIFVLKSQIHYWIKACTVCLVFQEFRLLFLIVYSFPGKRKFFYGEVYIIY